MRKPTPESELTEAEVRQGFNRLRELHDDDVKHIQELKKKIKSLNIENVTISQEKARYRKQVKALQQEIDKLKKEPKKSFKQTFLDSL